MVSRRTFIAAASGIGIAGAIAAALRARTQKRARPSGLVDEPLGLLSVLPGFEVLLLDKTGDRMSDGFQVPALPDGMGVLAGPSGKLVLMRNHELSTRPEGAAYDAASVPKEAYDPSAFGGVTRLVVDPGTLAVEHSSLALAGTVRNCAGGTSPWGWLSCEEDVSKGHGYTFLCDHTASALAPPRRIDAYGRFRHEAVALDHPTAIAYLTEDQPDGCLYRFVPSDRAAPFTGQLQALKVIGQTDTGVLRMEQSYQVEWVPLDSSDSLADDLRARARTAGASIVRRGEGIALHQSPGGPELFFSATTGGAQSRGQILRLLLRGDSGDLFVIAEAGVNDELDMPDNLCIGASGHIFIAEDGDPPNGIRVIAPNGRLITLAVNRGSGEVAGVSLSPSGDVLFANLQQRGVTLAIRGPLSELG